MPSTGMSGLSSNGSQRTNIFTSSGSFVTARSKLRLATKHQGQMASETFSSMRDVLFFASDMGEGLSSMPQLTGPQTAPCARSFIGSLLYKWGVDATIWALSLFHK